MSSLQEKVFVLKVHRLNEADLIVHALTHQGNRLHLLARSALKSRKRFGGGVLEPTHFIQITYQARKSARDEQPLHTLAEASLIGDFKGVRSDYKRLELALHFVSLINQVTQGGDQHSPDLFNLLGNSLRAAESSAELAKLKTHFEVKLLLSQGQLNVREEEDLLCRAAISEHEKLELTPESWRDLRARTDRELREYLNQTDK